jgi:hypothetical protein
VTFLGDNSRKIWAAASVVACAVAFAGCDSCDDILNIGGATLTGPDAVQPGVPTTFTVTGQIGPAGKKCPKVLQMSYVEVDAKGRPVTTALASKGAAKDRKVRSKKTSTGCRLLTPVKVALAISPGRHDQHRVKVTASLHSAPPPAPDPKDDPGTALGKLFAALAVGEDSKIVTVQGDVANQPPVANFITSQNPAITGQPLGLDARQSTDPDGSIVKYEWDLNGDGTYEKSSASPTGVQVDSAAANSQSIRLRVTDDKGAQTVSAPAAIPSYSSQVYAGGDPTLTPESTGPGKPITVTPKTTTPAPASADLYCDDVFTSTVTMQQDFGAPCTFATAGFHVVAVTYRDSASSSLPYYPTTYYHLAQIVPGARSAAKKQTALSVPLSLSGAKLKRLGKLKLAPTSAIVRGLLATGTGKGKVPKGTPKRYRAAMKTLASGRFALGYSGSARLLSTTITLSGKATMLVRSRHSRKTQVCLSVKAAGGGGKARFKVLGATGRARGFGASGTGPVLSFGKGTGHKTTVSLTPKRGKAHGLTRSCRALSRVLSGKKH